LGHVDEADTLLEEALHQPSLGTEARLALLDSQAQASLLRRDLAAGHALLARIDGLLAGNEPRWDWASLSRQETRVRLALADGAHDLAARLARDARHAARHRGDGLHATLFALLEADARLTRGELAEARRLVDGCGGPSDAVSLVVAAERERLRARLAVYSADLRGARVHAVRARRLVDAVGTAQQRLTLHQQMPDAFEAPSARAALDALPARAHLGETSGRAGLRWMGHLLTVAQHPRLLADEVLDVLRGHPQVAAAHVLLTGTDVATRGPRAGFGPQTPAADWQTLTWLLGDTREGRLQLRVWLRDGPGHEEIGTLGELVAAAVALVQERRHALAPIATWSDAPGEPPVFGVFGPSMQAHVGLLQRAAITSAPVLVTGETGTGKELVARELHRLSRAATGAFVPFNCAAVPRDMLESQLFGHRRGAFTGAAADFGGFVREATGGTLFLDEIGELDVTLQPKLLRFLETGEVQRLGDARPASFDIRTIAATNADVDTLLGTGSFREDLYHRLAGIRLHLPPLRDRRDDVAALARHFLERFAREAAKPALRLSAAAIELLTLYDWPGNVRELLNEMRRLTTFVEPDTEVGPDQLSRPIRSRALRAAQEAGESVHVRADQTLPEAQEELERALVSRALARSEGRVGEAASILGLSRKGLYLVRKRLGLT
ncbi:MAG: sigma-54 dependent transcriptional regulator, partial [Vicinamibacterales bacterium]|nr:sigma-54 dependent transcriptional regulator [Vicinamibacterales bacterium]